ncbi:MAG: prepilin-type N-terminal cleavage/methylation domain-containing protein [Candidatus Paceibacterota bacterium]
MVINTIFSKSIQNNSNRGFGLIELMVSIGIIALVMGIVMVRQSAFNGATLLRDQAYVLALAIREIQLLAVSAERTDAGFRNVYGFYFNTDTPNNYIVFRDGNNNNFFDSGEQYGKQSKIDGRFGIDEIRLVGSGSTPDEVSIVFERPNFDAVIYTAPGTPASANVSGVEIDIRVKDTVGDEANKLRTIEITRAGQISVLSI